MSVVNPSHQTYTMGLALMAVSLAICVATGFLITDYSPTTWLLVLSGCIAVVATCRSPYVGLLLIIVLESFRVQDAILTGGNWLTGAKGIGLLTFAAYTANIVVRRAFKLRRSPLDVPLMALTGMAILSLLWSADLGQGIDTASSFISLFGLYFLIVQLITDEVRLLRMIDVLILVSVVLLIMQAANVGLEVILDPLTAITRRIGYGFGNPNGLALWLVLVLGPVMARFLYARRQINALAYLTLACIFTYFLLLTASRGGWLAALTVVIVLVMGRRKRISHGMPPQVRGILQHSRAVLLLLSSVLVLSWGWSAITGRWMTLWSNLSYSSRRFGDLQVAWHAFLSNPLLGVGIGGYRQEVSFLLEALPGLYAAPSASHNLYLGVLAKMGLLGFVAFAWVFFSVVQVARRKGRAMQPHSVMVAFRGLTASLLGFAVDAFFHGGLFYNMVWIVLGLFYVSSIIAVEPPALSSAGLPRKVENPPR